MNTRRSVAARALPGAILLLAAIPLWSGCEKKLTDAECTTLRGQAFELLNKAQPCANDGDCQQSEWPGCERPVNKKTFDELKPFRGKFQEGKCAETKQECRKPPVVYCKQGLCVHKEVGITPTEDIVIE